MTTNDACDPNSAAGASSAGAAAAVAVANHLHLAHQLSTPVDS